MLSKLPQPFWAVILAALGGFLALAVLFHGKDLTISSAVLTVAHDLVIGALGAFAGHAVTPKADVTAGSAPVTINQQP